MDNTDRLFINLMIILVMVHGCTMNLSQSIAIDKAVKEIKTSIEEVKNSNHTKE